MKYNGEIVLVQTNFKDICEYKLIGHSHTGSKQKWVPLEIEHPKTDRRRKGGKPRENRPPDRENTHPARYHERRSERSEHSERPEQPVSTEEGERPSGTDTGPSRVDRRPEKGTAESAHEDHTYIYII